MKPSVVKPIGVEQNNAKNGVIPCLVRTMRLSFRNEGLTRQEARPSLESLALMRLPAIPTLVSLDKGGDERSQVGDLSKMHKN
jgi:hypothetical protein